jgi:DNA-binding CsgD family transcriptional regulator
MDVQPVLKVAEDLVCLIDSSTFGQSFYDTVNRMIGIDHCTVFVCDEATPRTLVAEARTHSAAACVRQLASSYIAGGYLRDPIWNTCEQANSRTLLLSPLEFSDPRYRHEFYEQPNVKNELAVTATRGRERIYASFYRENGSPDFSCGEIEWLQTFGSLIIQVIAKHAEIRLRSREEGPPCAPPEEQHQLSRQQMFQQVLTAISHQSTHLTRREAEICASIVLGYTVLGISMNLGISVNTVATHRKRAYAKLRVSSQNELFARYFSLVQSTIN